MVLTIRLVDIVKFTASYEGFPFVMKKKKPLVDLMAVSGRFCFTQTYFVKKRGKGKLIQCGIRNQLDVTLYYIYFSFISCSL